MATKLFTIGTGFLLITFNCLSQGYNYDGNGNLSKDANKKISSIHYNYLNLADTIVFEDDRKIIYTYSAAGQKLHEQAINADGRIEKNADYIGGFLYNNDSLRQIREGSGRVVPILVGNPASPWEYQYDQKDHLGNVRTLLTSQPDIDNNKATLETPNVAVEQRQFQRYKETRLINSALFDHTRTGTTGFSQRLNGSANEKYGLAKSMSVMPGDVINFEVFAKYVDTDASHWQAVLTDLMTQIANNAIGTVVDGAAYATSGGTPFPFAGLSGTADNTDAGPKAYLNWLIFNKNFVFVNGGYVKMSARAKEDGSDVVHEQLSKQLEIKEPGYVYAYLSNEEPLPLDIFFDDFTVELVKGPIVQQTDYDPFGLVLDEITREHAEPNNFLYSGKELQKDFDLNWYDYGARMYDAALGRWHVVDPKAEKYQAWSPYNFVMNNPLKYVDPDGEDLIIWYVEDGNEKSYRFKGGTPKDLPKNPFVQNVVAAYNYLTQKRTGDKLKGIATGSRDVNVKELHSKDGDPPHAYAKLYIEQTNTINWDPYAGVVEEKGIESEYTDISPATNLETQAAWAYYHVNPKKSQKTGNKNSIRYIDPAAWEVLTEERRTATKVGEVKEAREIFLDRKFVRVTGPTSTRIVPATKLPEPGDVP